MFDDSAHILKPMLGTTSKRCDYLLTHLMAKRKALHFNQPVDTEKLPNYPTVVKQPMDLGTIKQQLQRDMPRPLAEKRYQFVEELAHDVRLVWKNAFLFNHPDHAVFQAAEHMAKDFEEKLNELEGELERDAPPCPMPARCQILLTDLRRNPLTEWFRREQDWRNQGAAYTSKIAQPIDLDRVQRKLDAGDYGAKPDAETAGDFNLTSFKNDVLLVFQNAEAFNEDGAQPQRKKQRRGSGAQAAIKNPYKRIAQLLIKTFNLRFETLCTKVRQEAPFEPAKPDRDGMPTFDEKRELYRACAQLPLYEAGRVHELLQRARPAAAGVSGGVREVDIDKLDAAAFRAVERAANSYMQSQLFGDE